MSNLSGIYRSRVNAVNMATLAATLIFTTVSDRGSFYVTHITPIVRAASSVVGAASASFGSNSSNYNNILAITALTGLTAASNYLPNVMALATGVGVVAASTGVFIKVTTAITGTSQTMDFVIDGFYDTD